ncbi:MAG TPA: hypothetical protein VKA89_03510 [Solirubrobacterales bacterium]|nr:hypothetical protein [Solirubrobacterales bacterium]
MDYPLENALFQWEEGWRRLQGLRGDPDAQRRAERIVAAVNDELRRRIGPTFRAAELARLYAAGTDWCLEAAMGTGVEAPEDPLALGDAAFWLYLRGASDYAGGRQLALD